MLQLNQGRYLQMNPARFALILKLCFLVASILFTYVAYTLPVQPGPPISQTFEFGITALALVDILMAFVLPPFLARAAARKAPGTSPVPPLQQWTSRNLVALAFLESSVLFGFVLHVLGANPRLAFTVMGIGIFAILLWRPSAPPAVQPPSAPLN